MDDPSHQTHVEDGTTKDVQEDPECKELRSSWYFLTECICGRDNASEHIMAACSRPHARMNAALPPQTNMMKDGTIGHHMGKPSDKPLAPLHMDLWDIT